MYYFFSTAASLYQIAHFLNFQHTLSYFWHTFSYCLSFQLTFSTFSTLSKLLALFLNFSTLTTLSTFFSFFATLYYTCSTYSPLSQTFSYFSLYSRPAWHRCQTGLTLSRCPHLSCSELLRLQHLLWCHNYFISSCLLPNILSTLPAAV